MGKVDQRPYLREEDDSCLNTEQSMLDLTIFVGPLVLGGGRGFTSHTPMCLFSCQRPGIRLGRVVRGHVAEV